MLLKSIISRILWLFVILGLLFISAYCSLSQASPTVTVEEHKLGYRLTTCIIHGEESKVNCRINYKVMSIEDYIAQEFNAEFVEYSIQPNAPRYPLFIIKIKLRNPK